MSRTRIQLVTGENLPLTSDISYSLNFLIADIREPDKRSGNFSKTIEVPSSKIADTFFRFAFNIDAEDGYNPNLKVAASIYIDDIEQINGFIQLMSITNKDSYITYNVQIKGNVTNIFQEWADTLLENLDLSAYDHTYDKATQIASWTAPVGQGYVYPMIDYGVTNGLTYDVNNFMPAIYVKQYIDSAFALAGYTYQSNFFDTDFFQRLIIPYNSNSFRLTQADVDLRIFEGTRDINITLADVIGGYTETIPYNAEVTDVSNQFDVTTYKATILESGTYRFASVNNFRVDAITGSFNGSAEQIQIYIKRNRGGVITTLAADGKYLTPFLTTEDFTSSLYTPNISCLAGDIIYCEIRRSDYLTLDSYGNPIESWGWDASYDNYYQLTILTDSIFYDSVINASIIDGNSVNMSSGIPSNIKIKDFFKWIINMFNLYIETDKIYSNVLYIEPRNDFYANGTTIDWTDKLAIDRDIVITPMGELDAIEYRFQYKEDKDYFNAKYKASYDENYGTYRKIIENDFLKNTKLTEVGFSPTPLTNIGGTDRILSQIITTNATGSISDMKACNIRILYYGGEKLTLNSWTYTSALSGTTTETTYPYCGHVDEPLEPRFDLSFGVPFEVFYDTTHYTNNNLYNVYYSDYINEISNQNSKIVTAYLNLTPRDIATLDFRNTFYIDKYHLRLNKIFDYNFVNESLTKCEFIRINKTNPFIPDKPITIGGVDTTFLNGDNTPAVLGTIATASLFGNVVAHSNIVSNTIRGCVITGTDNFIGDGCENIILDNCTRCTIPSGSRNVSLTNCSDLTIAQSDVTYVSNSVQNSDSVIFTLDRTINSADLLTSNTTPVLLIESQGVGKVIEILSVFRHMTFNTTAYAGNTDLEVYTDTATLAQFNSIGGLSAIGSRAIFFRKTISTSPSTDIQIRSNKGIYLRTTTADPTSGDSAMRIFLTYRIITI
ncbi:hypothetical protein UFOVP212_12 [uncultured Caudovirales phage]|uniref:Uncharacterized protein n=1 Tax=uncultured Caudovirales phage TaxID=2100421 RepID=A0A6J7WKK3_9CAUD|nr:hypothetical protein UFOVP212_12 [uncultured Caudovirales phage]